MALRQTFAILGSRAGVLATYVLLLYVPCFAIYGAVVSFASLPAQGADAVLGFASLLVSPLVNAGIVHVASQAQRGASAAFKDVWSVARRAWGRLLPAYIAISFVWLAYLVITVGPGAVVLYLLDVKSPYALIPFGIVGTLIALPPYAFVDAFVVLEGHQAYQARQASWGLAKGRRLRILSLVAMVAGLPLTLELASWVFDAQLAAFFGGEVAATVTLGLIVSVLYVPTTVLTYVLYAEAKAGHAAMPAVLASQSDVGAKVLSFDPRTSKQDRKDTP